MHAQLGPDLVVKCFTRFSAGAVLLAAVAFAAQAAPAPADLPRYTPVDAPDIYSPSTTPVASKVYQDTIWIADWSFDLPGGGCTDDGWVKWDLHVYNDGSNYWQVSTDYSGTGGGRITNAAAVLRKHDLCWVAPDGYGNYWDYSIILDYEGSSATLSCELVADIEYAFDRITLEADSLGLSEARVDLESNVASIPELFRDHLLTLTGNNAAGITVSSLQLRTTERAFTKSTFDS